MDLEVTGTEYRMMTHAKVGGPNKQSSAISHPCSLAEGTKIGTAKPVVEPVRPCLVPPCGGAVVKPERQTWDPEPVCHDRCGESVSGILVCPLSLSLFEEASALRV